MTECDACSTSRTAFEEAVSIASINGDLDKTMAAN